MVEEKYMAKYTTTHGWRLRRSTGELYSVVASQVAVVVVSGLVNHPRVALAKVDGRVRRLASGGSISSPHGGTCKVVKTMVQWQSVGLVNHPRVALAKVDGRVILCRRLASGGSISSPHGGTCKVVKTMVQWQSVRLVERSTSLHGRWCVFAYAVDGYNGKVQDSWRDQLLSTVDGVSPHTR
jgi:hypothetical protein